MNSVSRTKCRSEIKKSARSGFIITCYVVCAVFGGIRCHSVEKGKIIEITQWPGNTYQ